MCVRWCCMSVMMLQWCITGLCYRYSWRSISILFQDGADADLRSCFFASQLIMCGVGHVFPAVVVRSISVMNNKTTPFNWEPREEIVWYRFIPLRDLLHFSTCKHHERLFCAFLGRCLVLVCVVSECAVMRTSSFSRWSSDIREDTILTQLAERITCCMNAPMVWYDDYWLWFLWRHAFVDYHQFISRVKSDSALQQELHGSCVSDVAACQCWCCNDA